MTKQSAPSEMLRNTADDAAKMPSHQQVYADLRVRVLFGEFAPGQPLTIQGLVAATGAGMTPVREALRRLISEGAVEMLGNRRLTVPVLSDEQAEQLEFVRSSLEPELTRRAAERISDGHIATLEQVDTNLNEAIERGDIAAYLRENYEFHRGLYAIAAAPVIADTVDRLWLRFGPSLRVVCGRFGTFNLPDKHADILDALKTGDAEAAAAAMREDVRQGMEYIARATDSVDSE